MGRRVRAWQRPAVGFVAFQVTALLLTLYFVCDIDALPSLRLFVLPILLIEGLSYADWKWLKPRSPA